MHKHLSLKAHEIHKKFGETAVIHGVNITLYQGEFLAIMGPSGSGKSTLLHCLAGIVDTDSGEIFYNDLNITKLDQKTKTKLRTTDFGFIFQFGELVPELPARDNVALPLLLRGVNKKDAYNTADTWLDRVGISQGIARELPHVLSGGEVQRTAIARAMAIDPKIIFADEPTGSLDSVNADKIMKLLATLANQYEKSIILVTHSDKSASYADKTITLRDGKITDESV